MLGYSFGLPTNESHFGQVSKTFGTDEARCLGNETSLLDCPHVAVNDCGSDEAAGVICSNPGIFTFNQKAGLRSSINALKALKA